MNPLPNDGGALLPTEDAYASLDYLTNVLGGRLGFISIVTADDFTGRRFTTDDDGLKDAARYAWQKSRAGVKGVWYQSTTLRTLPTRGRGGADLAGTMTSLWMDGDFGTDGHAAKANGLPKPPDEDAVRLVVAESGLPDPSLWVHSGNGLNGIWLLDEDVNLAASGEHAARVSDTVQKLLAATALKRGWSWDAGVGNLDRIMRLPGTVNRKARPKLSHVVPGTGERFAFAELAATVLARREDALSELEAFAVSKRPKGPTSSRKAATSASTGFSGDRPLDIFDRTVSWADILAPLGWTEVGTGHVGGDVADLWMRPSNGGASSSAYSAKTLDGCLINWSEAVGLPTGIGLSKAYVWTFFHYGDSNWTAAVRDLMAAACGHVADCAAASQVPAACLAELKQQADRQQADRLSSSYLPDVKPNGPVRSYLPDAKPTGPVRSYLPAV